jgi:hypothetical protein
LPGDEQVRVERGDRPDDILDPLLGRDAPDEEDDPSALGRAHGRARKARPGLGGGDGHRRMPFGRTWIGAVMPKETTDRAPER